MKWCWEHSLFNFHIFCFSYESKGKAWAKSRPDHPIGLAPDDVAKLKEMRENDSKENSIPGLPQNAKQGYFFYILIYEFINIFSLVPSKFVTKNSVSDI